MTKIGIGLPGRSVAEVGAAAQAAAPYGYDSFSVYGDLGDLPPYAVLHAAAHHLKGSRVRQIGPMGVPVGMQHSEVIGMHSVALEEQLPGQSYVGLVRGAFLEQIGEQPASLSQLESTVASVRATHRLKDVHVPIYLGGFGPKLLAMAGRLGVDGVKLGGTTNIELARAAKVTINNPETAIVLGAVSVVDENRKMAREVARREVAKYLDVVGGFDPTLDEDEQASLQEFRDRFPRDPRAYTRISDSLLDKFALAGTPAELRERIVAMKGIVDRFELGTPHGLTDRSTALRLAGNTMVNEQGE